MRSPALVIGLFLVITTFGITTTASPAHAGVTEFLGLVIAWVMHYIVAFEGWLLIKMVGILIWVAQYNGFVNAVPVATGWFIVRDIVNMFFILMLLVIAFGTILGVERYNYQKTLPTLLLSAVLVNFSRTFCGIFIDISQVIMLTFVNGFSEAATGNFANAFRINKLLDAGTAQEGGDDGAAMMKLVAGWILAAVLVGFSLIVIVYMTIVLIFRIIYLWIVVIMSPAAYFLRGIPLKAGQEYYNKWWNYLIKNLVAGPFIAFFLWLSLLTVAGGTGDEAAIISKGGFAPVKTDTGETNGVEMGLFTSSDLQAYMIGMAMLMGGMQIAQDLSGLKTGEITGAAGKAWKGTKGAIDSTKKTWDKAADTKLGQTIGRGRDNMKGMALNLAARVPGMKGAATKARARLDEQMAKGASKADTKYLANANPDQVATIAGSISKNRLSNALKSPQKLAEEKAILEKHMANLAKGKGTKPNPPQRAGEEKKDYEKRTAAYNDRVKKEYQATAKQVMARGAATRDTFGTEERLKAINKTRPDLIVDDKEKDPVKREKQRKELEEGSRAMGVTGMRDAPDSAFKAPSVMNMSAKNLKAAYDRGDLSNDKVEALKKMNVDLENRDPRAIQSDLDRLKMENSSYLTDGAREKLIENQRKSLGEANATIADPNKPDDKKAEAQQARMEGLQNLANLSRNGKMDKDTLAVFAAVPGGAAILAKAISGGAQVSAEDLKGAGMSAGVASSLKPSDISKLQPDMAKAMRGELAQAGAHADALAAGASTKDAFGNFGYNPKTGTATDAEAFGAILKADPAAMAAHFSPKEIGRNGGVNDVSMNIVSTINVEGLKAMGRDGNEKGTKAVVESALAIRDADPATLIEQYKQKMMAGGMDAGASDQAATAYAGRLSEAQDKAKAMITEIEGSDSPLSAAVEAGTKKRNRDLWKKEIGSAKVDMAQSEHEARLQGDPKYADKFAKRETRRAYKEESRTAAGEVAARRQEQSEKSSQDAAEVAKERQAEQQSQRESRDMFKEEVKSANAATAAKQAARNDWGPNPPGGTKTS